MGFKNLKLRTKIIMGIGVPLVLALLLGLTSIINIQSMQETQLWVEHTHKVIEQAENIVAAAVDMETGMRGYLLAGKEAFLEPYHQGEKIAYVTITTLQKMVNDNPKQVERLGEAKKILQEWQGQVVEPVIALRREIGDADTMNDLTARVKKAEGKVFFDKFRGLIATFIAHEETLLREHKVAANESNALIEENTQIISETVDWVDHTFRVMARANKILAVAADMETGMRGFMLTGKENFLDTYTAGKKKFLALITILSVTVKDNPAQVTLLGKMKKTINEWQQQVVNPSISLRRRVGTGYGTTMDDVATLMAKAKGKKYFDQFRSQINTFIAREKILINERQQLANEATIAEIDERELVNELTTKIAHVNAVIARANGILLSAVDMETGLRGFLLSGTEEFLEPYRAGQEMFESGIATLSQKVSDNPAQVELLGKMQDTMNEWQKQVMEPEILLRRQIGDAKTMDDMADTIGEARGKVFFDKFRGVMADFVSVEEKLMGQRQEINAATVENTIKTILGALMAAIMIGVFGGIIIIRSISRSLNQAIAVNVSVANGDLDVDIQINQEDEVGQMLMAMKRMVGKLKEIIESVSNSARNVASGSLQMSKSSSEMSQGAREQAAATAEASATVTQMVANIRKNAEYALQTETIAVQAAEDARKSEQAVADTVVAMREISQKIAMIEDIATQTKMLSLNASIEAARAQEHGRGFAVVATEVRALATRSSATAVEIIKLANTSTSVAEKAGVMLNNLVPNIQKTSQLVKEISSATNEQHIGAEQINLAIQQLNNVTQQNATASEQLATTADYLSNQSGMLQQSIAFFSFKKSSRNGQNKTSDDVDSDHGIGENR